MKLNTTSQSEQQLNATISNLEAHPRKKSLTFGDFVAGVYHTWGKRRAKGIIDLAINVHVIEFRGAERFVIS